MSYFCNMTTIDDASVETFLKSVDFDVVPFLALFGRPLNLNTYWLWDTGTYKLPTTGALVCDFCIERTVPPNRLGVFSATIERDTQRVIRRTPLDAEVDLGFQYLRSLDAQERDEAALAFLTQVVDPDEKAIESAFERSLTLKQAIMLSRDYQLCVGERPTACDAISMQVVVNGRVWSVHVVHRLERYMLRTTFDECSTLFLIRCYANIMHAPVRLSTVADDYYHKWLQDFALRTPETFITEAMHTWLMVWDRNNPSDVVFTQQVPLTNEEQVQLERVLCARLLFQ